MADQKPPPELGQSRLTRPGAADSEKRKLARLPSIRAPRDLTLGGVRKKTFAPSIPARRDKVKEEVKSEASDSQSGVGVGGRGRGRKDGQGRGRGRGRGRFQQETIQSMSIFEQGPGERSLPRRGADMVERSSSKPRSGGGGGGGGGAGVKIERNTDEDTKKVLENLLRDDFIADDDLTVEEPSMTPIRLPLVTDIKKEVKKEKSTDCKVKDEPLDEVDSSASANIAMMADSVKIGGTRPKIKTAAQLFTLPVKTESDELIFLQLPDTLPGEPPLRGEEERKPGPPKGTDPKAGTSQNAADAPTKQETKSQQELLAERLGLCSLSDFEEGYIGKLQIHKSGRVKLALGTVTLDVTMGTPASFLQDLVSVRLNGNAGDMTVLGHIQHKLVCTPDFDTLLSLPR